MTRAQAKVDFPQLEALLELLAEPRAEGVFNPWSERDPEHDATTEAPGIRRRQLRQYLAERLGHARYLLLGEALGYQGGHFSGIPMTSERILLGHLQADRGIAPAMVFSELEPRRTSRPELRPKGFSEPTATIAWGLIAERGWDPRRFLIWNAFPWHPYDPRRGRLSNRTPRPAEMQRGAPALERMRRLFPDTRIVAVGKKAAALLESAGQTPDSFHCVRHPANGGATAFAAQLRAIVEQSDPGPAFR